MAKKKILVTGGAGFVGSHVMQLHPDADCIDIKNWRQDIREPLPKKDYTHIYHLAALRSVPKGEMYPDYFIETNCWGTMNLARTYPKARIINISSSAAEAHTSVYGWTKYCTEQIKHPNWLNVRLYNVFGEDQPLESGAIVPAIFDCILNKKELTLYGDGKQTRDFSYVGDVVETLCCLMFSKLTGLEHICEIAPITVDSLINQCVSISGITLHLNRLKKLRQGDVLHSPEPDNSFFMGTYGRKEGLRRTWEWWKKSHSM